MFEKIRTLLRRAPAPPPPGEKPLDQFSVERILGVRIAKDSFDACEDLSLDLARGATWRRRRMFWADVFTGEDMGLCVNEIRVAAHAGARVIPGVSMEHPELVNFEDIEYAYWQTHWASGAARQSNGVRASRLFVNTRSLTCSNVGAPRGPWEDLEALQTRLRRGEFDPSKLDLIPHMHPVWREVKDTNIEVARYLPAFPPSAWVQADEHILAATAAGFFLNFPEEYEDGVSALHQPVGALFSHGRLHVPPWIKRPCALEWADGVRRIEHLGPENLAMRVGGSALFQLTLGIEDPQAPALVWRSFDGEVPRAEHPDTTVDLVFCGTGLVSVNRAESARPPLGGAIVRLAGEAAVPWLDWLTAGPKSAFPKWSLELHTTRQVPLRWVVAGGPKLLNDGSAIPGEELLRPWASAEFRAGGPAPTRFPYDSDSTRGPRTALGLTARDEWVIVVVDGRTELSHSAGLTLLELSLLMQHLGCVFALNLDGGGSAVMAIEGVGPLDQLKPDLASNVVNIPSDSGNRERIVPVSLTVVKD